MSCRALSSGRASSCVGLLLFLPPGGPSAVFALAAEHHKFSLETEFRSLEATIPVLLIYGSSGICKNTSLTRRSCSDT